MRDASFRFRSFLKRSLTRIASIGNHLRPARRRRVVLCLHSVREKRSFLAITPTDFHRLLDVLDEENFQHQSIDQIVARESTPDQNLAHLTFDDGFVDNRTVVAPILKKRGVGATFYLTTGLVTQNSEITNRYRRYISKHTDFLSPEMVKELSDEGFTIGAHAHTHKNLYHLDDKTVLEELNQSKSLLESMTNQPVYHFAYPFGVRHIHYSQRTVDLVKGVGFNTAAAISFRALKDGDLRNPLELPRFFVTRQDIENDFELLRLKLRGGMDWLGEYHYHAPRFVKMLVATDYERQ